MFFWNQLSTILQLGFIYGIVALGVFITYKILDFPDLSVDGTFPLGGVITAVMIAGGCNVFLGMLCSLLVGAAGGFLTGILHVKLKISNLLSGIITMTALLSVNYLIAGGAMVSFATQDTLFKNALTAGLSPVAANYVRVGILLAVVIVCKILLDLYFKTKSGFMLRATGDNPQLVTSLGQSSDKYKIIGLVVANALVALAGSLYCQQGRVYNSSMGTGTVVVALASVIIGTVFSKRIRIMKGTTGALIGAVVYYAVMSLAILFIGSQYQKLVMAALFVLILVFDRRAVRRRRAREKGKEAHNAQA